MTLEKLYRGRALYAEKDRLWVARGMSFFAINSAGRKVTHTYSVGSLKQKLFASNRLSRQLLREGIHHLLPLANGNIFVTTKRKSYVIAEDGQVLSTFEGYSGNKPGHQGICRTPDGTIFFGEYTLNPKRDHDTRLFRSVDNGKTFKIVMTLTGKEVRHIHFVKYDPYEKCLWLGTGDENFECKLMRSDDNGESWETIGEGNQDWRAIGVCFTRDFLIWGTDAGSVPDQNHIICMNRKTRATEVIANAEGPCHGCADFADGRVFISTGVEGGENEKDRCARLKEIRDDGIVECGKAQKDIFPLILQYGVMRFPLGTTNTDKVVFTMMGLKAGGEKIYVYD